MRRRVVQDEVAVDEDGHELLAADRDDRAAVVGVDVDPLDVRRPCARARARPAPRSSRTGSGRASGPSREPTRGLSRRRRHGRCCRRSRRPSGLAPGPGPSCRRPSRSMPLGACGRRRLASPSPCARSSCDSSSSRPAARARAPARAGRPAARSCSRVTRWTPRPDGDGEHEPEQAEQHVAHQLVPASGRTTSARVAGAAVARADRRGAAPAPRQRLDDREAEPGSGPVGAAAAEPLEDTALVSRRHARAPRRARRGGRSRSQVTVTVVPAGA